MLRHWRRIFGVAALMLLLMGAVGAWLLTSASGLRVVLNQLQPTLNYQSAEGNLFAAKLNGIQLDLGATKLSSNQVELKWQPLALVFGNLPIALVQFDSVVVTPQPPTTESKQTWAGTTVPIDLTLERFLVTNLVVRPANGEALEVDRLEGTLSIENNQLQISNLTLANSVGLFAASGKIDLNAQGVVQLEHSAELNGSEDKPEIFSAGTVKGVWSSLEVQQQIKSVDGQGHEATAQVKGTITGLLSQEPGSQLAGTWNLPLRTVSNTGEDSLLDGVHNAGTFSVSGSIDNYQLQFDTKTSSAESFLMTASATGRGNLSGVELSQLEAFDKGSQRMLSGTAQLSWQSELQATFDLRLSNFQPAQFFPGMLDPLTNLNASLTGSLQSNAVDDDPFSVIGEVSVQELSALWRGSVLTGQANLSATPNELQVTKTLLKIADSSVNLDGVANSESLDLSWQLAAPQLSKLATNLSGSVNGRGQLLGSLEAPRIVADLSGAKLTVALHDQPTWHLDDLSLQLDTSPGNPTAPLVTKFDIGEVRQGVDSLVESAAITLRGSQQQHNMVLSAKLPNEVKIDLGMKGGFSQFILDDLGASLWAGELSKAEVSVANSASWSLREAARISLSANDMELAEACWKYLDQGLCLKGKGSSKDLALDASVQMRNVDVSRPVEIATQGKAQLSGRLEGAVRILASGESQPLRITADVDGRDWNLRLPDLIDEDEAAAGPRFLTFKTAKLTARTDEEFTARLSLVVDDEHFLTGNLKSNVPLSLAEIGKTPIQGELQLAWQDMSTLPADLFGDVALNGQLQSRIQITGSADQPRIEINAEVTDAKAQIAAAGLNLTDIQLQAESNQTGQITFQGSLVSGEGTLNLEGGLDLASIQTPTAELRLWGSDLTLLQTADISAQGSVDLRTKLADQIVDLSGVVALSEADLRIGPTENVVSASPDVVLLGEVNSQQAIKQRLNVQLDLGEQTKLSAAGLNAELKGQLNIRQQPGQIMTGVGQISVENGVYNAYGQALIVDEGRLIFNQTSIDDPQLALQASRESSGIQVGVRVRGRAQQPSLVLYSNPAMSDQDILSTLIFGKPVSGLSADDSLTLLRIASAIRSGKPDQFTRLSNSLQETLGLTDLEFRLLGDNPEVIAGKQLTSRFYIGYGYGLLDAAQSLVLRYKINQAWSVQGDFGANSGADLRYQLER